MNMMRISYKTLVSVAVFFTCCGSVYATPSLLVGDQHITANGSDLGHLEIDGGLSIDGNLSDFGTTGTTGLGSNSAALSFTYTESGTTYTVTLEATRASTAFLWQDSGTGTAKNKMKLGSDNTVSLYNYSTQAVGITLNPNTGVITLAGSSSGLQLNDGTLLSGASSLRQSSLYDSSGNVVVHVNSDGSLTVSNGVTFQQPVQIQGNSLTGTNVAGLQDTLTKLGYGASTPTVKLLAAAGASVSIVAMKTDATGNTFSLTGNSVTKFSNAGDVIWTTKLNGGPDGVYFDLNLDAAGNVLIVGRYGPTISVGTATLSPGPDANGADSFIAKIDKTSGEAIWLKNSDPGIYSCKIGADPSGNIFVAGNFGNSLTIGSQTLTSIADQDAFLAKYDSSGNPLWLVGLGLGAAGDSNGDCFVNGLNVDASNNISIAGHFTGEMTGSWGTFYTTGEQDGFIIKYDTDGNYSTSTQINCNSGGYAYVNSVKIDSSGNTYLIGSASDTMTMGSQTFGGAGNFVIKLDSSLNELWYQNLNASQTAFDIDSSGNVIVAGSFSGSATLGTQTLTSAGGSDGFVTKISSSGSILAAYSYGSAGNESIQLINAKGSNFRTACNFSQNISLGGGALPIGNCLVDLPSQTLGAVGSAPLSWGNSQAGGAGSIALGDASLATGTNSIAVGQGYAAGANSFSEGLGSIASSQNSLAFNGGQASGDGSIAFGTSIASGPGSVSFNGGTASGTGSIAFNSGAATGFVSVAFGSSQATGQAASAFGIGTLASGNGSAAFGNATIANGNASFAAGQAAGADGSYSTALGLSSAAQGSASFAAGESTNARGTDSIALGYLTTTDGFYSLTSGMGTASRAPAQVVIGHYNIVEGNNSPSSLTNPSTWSASDPVFIIGNGTSSVPSDAFVVHRDGSAKFTGPVTVPQSGDIPMFSGN